MKKAIFSSLNILLAFFLFANLASASQSSGTIDATYHYSMVCGSDACATQTGNIINWKPTASGSIQPVTIDDSNGLDGNPWGNNLGWLNLGPSGTTSLSINPSTGIITGYAWSQIAGWINFSPTGYGVSINSNGEFTGYAWASGENGGWIKFDCSGGATSTCVKTDWRPVPNRTSTTPSGGGGGGGGGFVIPPTSGSSTNVVNLGTSTASTSDKFLQTQAGPQNQKNGDYSNLYRADINDDGHVDLFDFNLFMVNWGKLANVDSAIPRKDRCLKVNIGDMNCDGRVDILDFNILLINWGSRILGK